MLQIVRELHIVWRVVTLYIVVSVMYVCRAMSAEETQTKAAGRRSARSFTAREDLVEALVSLGVTRNAATRVLY